MQYSDTGGFLTNCVLLSSFQGEFTFLRNVFRFTGIRVHHAASAEEADDLLRATASPVLLVDTVFCGGCWRSALSEIGRRHPMVASLVIAESADQSSLEDLFSLGAVGVIWKPFEFQAVRRLIRAAHEASLERQLWREELLAQSRRRAASPEPA